MQPDRRPTLLEHCVGKLGVIKGARVVVDLGSWSFVMSQAKDWPEGEDRGVLTARMSLWADTFGYSDRTAWRRLSAFREAFPGEVDPTRIVRAVELRIADQKAATDVMAIGSLLVPS